MEGGSLVHRLIYYRFYSIRGLEVNRASRSQILVIFSNFSQYVFLYCSRSADCGSRNRSRAN